MDAPSGRSIIERVAPIVRAAQEAAASDPERAAVMEPVETALYMLDSHDPADVAEWFLGMNAEHLDSGRVHQDVLLMCGEHDAFQPPALTRAQAQALRAARSVTTRMFTRAEQADQHCQVGNLDLAFEVLTTCLQAADTDAGPSQ